jgi:hypothetical protein
MGGFLEIGRCYRYLATMAKAKEFFLQILAKF